MSFLNYVCTFISSKPLGVRTIEEEGDQTCKVVM